MHTEVAAACSQEEGLTRSRPHWLPDLGLPASRAARKQMFVYERALGTGFFRVEQTYCVGVKDEDNRGKRPFSSYHVQGTYYQRNL